MRKGDKMKCPDCGNEIEREGYCEACEAEYMQYEQDTMGDK